MNGPSHYREAERLIAEAAHWDRVPGTDSGRLIASAQIHATLALTAAVIAGNAHKMQPADRHEWLKATDPEYAAGQAPGAAL